MQRPPSLFGPGSIGLDGMPTTPERYERSRSQQSDHGVESGGSRDSVDSAPGCSSGRRRQTVRDVAKHLATANAFAARIAGLRTRSHTPIRMSQALDEMKRSQQAQQQQQQQQPSWTASWSWSWSWSWSSSSS